MSAYVEPTAQVVSADRDGDATTIRLRAEREHYEPLAPAGLYALDDSAREVIQLHKCTNKDGLDLWFETYDAEEPLPRLGERYIFRQWWLPECIELVTDLTREWVLEQYPTDSDDCDWCPLTYTWFGPGHGAVYATKGYRSGDVWITPEAYDRYIRRDILRMRTRLQ